jgi:hypothetical protein
MFETLKEAYSMEEIRVIAGFYGILSVARFENKKDLIHTIQLAEGKKDCFQSLNNCEDKKCLWRLDCLGSDDF